MEDSTYQLSRSRTLPAACGRILRTIAGRIAGPLWGVILSFPLLPLLSQNPIVPPGIYMADPTARVWDDGRLYIYGSVEVPDAAACNGWVTLAAPAGGVKGVGALWLVFSGEGEELFSVDWLRFEKFSYL